MKKCCLLLVVLLSCSLMLAPMAFADAEPEVVIVSQDDYGRVALSSTITPRYQICCTNGPSLAWRTTTVQHKCPAGGGICLGVDYVGDQYCQLCGHVWQSNVVYLRMPGCGLWHY